MRTLAEPETDLDGFVEELGDAARIVAPGLRAERAAVHRDGRHVRGDRRATSRRSRTLIEKRPPTLDVGDALAARPAAVPRRPRRVLAGLLAAPPRELRGALPTLNARGARSARRCSSASPALNEELRKTLRRAARPRRGARHQRGAARPDRDGHHAQPAAALPRPVRDGLQLLELLLDVRRRALLRARRHRLGPARAAQPRPAARTTRSARWAPTSPPTATAGPRGHAAVRAGPALRRRGRPRTAAPTARPASAASSSDQARFFPDQYKIARDPRSPGLQGPTFTGRARGARGPDVHGRARRPARTPTCRRSEQPVKNVHARPRRARRHRRRSSYFGWSPRRSRSSRTTRSRPRSRPRTTSAPGSPVRIAGVKVGKVTNVERAERRRDGAIVTMRIDDKGRPVHTDAHGQDPAAHLPRGQLLRRPHGRARRRRPSSTTARRSRSSRPPRRCSSTRC